MYGVLSTTWAPGAGERRPSTWSARAGVDPDHRMPSPHGPVDTAQVGRRGVGAVHGSHTLFTVVLFPCMIA
jgi:hypothetical protein